MALSYSFPNVFLSASITPSEHEVLFDYLEQIQCPNCGQPVISSNAEILSDDNVNISVSISTTMIEKNSVETEFEDANGEIIKREEIVASHVVVPIQGCELTLKNENNVEYPCPDFKTNSEGMAWCWIDTEAHPDFLTSSQYNILYISSSDCNGFSIDDYFIYFFYSKKAAGGINNMVALIALLTENSPLCVMFTVLLSLLAASLYFFGGNPLSALDIVTPRLKRFKAIRKNITSYKRSSHNLEKKEALRNLFAGYAALGAFKKSMEKTFGDLKIKDASGKMISIKKLFKEISNIPADKQLPAMMMLMKGKTKDLKKLFNGKLDDKKIKGYNEDAKGLIAEWSELKDKGTTANEKKAILEKLASKYGLSSQFTDPINKEGGINYMSQLQGISLGKQHLKLIEDHYSPKDVRIPLVGGVFGVIGRKVGLARAVRDTRDFMAHRSAKVRYLGGRSSLTDPVVIGSLFNPKKSNKVFFENVDEMMKEGVKKYMFLCALDQAMSVGNEDLEKTIKNLMRRSSTKEDSVQNFFSELKKVGIDTKNMEWASNSYNDLQKILQSNLSDTKKLKVLRTLLVPHFSYQFKKHVLNNHASGSVYSNDPTKSPASLFSNLTTYDALDSKDNVDKLQNIEKLTYAIAYHEFSERVMGGDFEVSFEDVLSEQRAEIDEMITGHLKTHKTITGAEWTKLDTYVESYDGAFRNVVLELDKVGEYADIMGMAGISLYDLDAIQDSKVLDSFISELRFISENLKDTNPEDTILNASLEKLESALTILETKTNELKNMEEYYMSFDATASIDSYVGDKIIHSHAKKSKFAGIQNVYESTEKEKSKYDKLFDSSLNEITTSFSNQNEWESFINEIKNLDPTFQTVADEYLKSINNRPNPELKDNVTVFVNELLKSGTEDNIAHFFNSLSTKGKISNKDALKYKIIYFDYPNVLNNFNDAKINFEKASLEREVLSRKAVVDSISEFLSKDKEISKVVLQNIEEAGLSEKLENFGKLDKIEQIEFVYQLHRVVGISLEQIKKSVDDQKPLPGTKSPPTKETIKALKNFSELEKHLNEIEKKDSEKLDIVGNRLDNILRDNASFIDPQILETAASESALIEKEYQTRFGDKWEEKVAKGLNHEDLAKGMWLYRADGFFCPYVEGMLSVRKSDSFVGAAILYNERGKMNFGEELTSKFEIHKDTPADLADKIKEAMANGYFDGKPFDPYSVQHRRSLHGKLEKLTVYELIKKDDGKIEVLALTGQAAIEKIKEYKKEKITKTSDYKLSLANGDSKQLIVDIGEDKYVPFGKVRGKIHSGFEDLDSKDVFSALGNAELLAKAANAGYLKIGDKTTFYEEHPEFAIRERLIEKNLTPLITPPLHSALDHTVNVVQKIRRGKAVGFDETLYLKFFDRILTVEDPGKGASAFKRIGYKASQRLRTLALNDWKYNVHSKEIMWLGIKAKYCPSKDAMDYSKIVNMQYAKVSSSIARHYLSSLAASGLAQPSDVSSLKANLKSQQLNLNETHNYFNSLSKDLEEKLRNGDITNAEYEEQMERLTADADATIHRIQKNIFKTEKMIDSANKKWWDTRKKLRAMSSFMATHSLTQAERNYLTTKRLKKAMTKENRKAFKTLSQAQKIYEDTVLKNALIYEWKLSQSMIGSITPKLDPNSIQRFNLTPFGVAAGPLPSDVLGADGNLINKFYASVSPIAYGLDMFKTVIARPLKVGSWSGDNTGLYDGPVRGPRKGEQFRYALSAPFSALGTAVLWSSEAFERATTKLHVDEFGFVRKTNLFLDKWARYIYNETPISVYEQMGITGKDYYMGTREFLPEQWELFQGILKMDKSRLLYKDFKGATHFVPSTARSLVGQGLGYEKIFPHLESDLYRDIYSRESGGSMKQAISTLAHVEKEIYLRYYKDQAKFMYQAFKQNPFYWAIVFPTMLAENLAFKIDEELLHGPEEIRTRLKKQYPGLSDKEIRKKAKEEIANKSFIESLEMMSSGAASLNENPMLNAIGYLGKALSTATTWSATACPNGHVIPVVGNKHPDTCPFCGAKTNPFKNKESDEDFDKFKKD